MFRFIRVRIGMTRSFHLIHLFSFLLIQSTLLREERHHGRLDKNASRLDFNPPSCERSDTEIMSEARLWEISIHAPARGATFHIDISNNMVVISIHAPARGATHFHRYAYRLARHFNPRSCERSNPVDTVPEPLACISIHAPARGATAKITYFSQNKDLCLGNTNNTQHYPNVQAKFKYEMLPIYLLSLVRTSL